MYTFKKNEDGSGVYSVEMQQVAGLLKASMSAIGPFPSVHYTDTPVMARLKPLILPTEIGQFTFAEDGRIQKMEYTGVVTAERGATCMEISLTSVFSVSGCVYQWLGLVQDDEGNWAKPAPAEVEKSAAAAETGGGEDGEDGAVGEDAAAAAPAAEATDGEEDARPPVPAAPELPVFRRRRSKVELGIEPEAPGPQQPPRAYADMFKLRDEMVTRNKALEDNGVGLMQTLLDRRATTGSMAVIDVDPTVDAGLEGEIMERIQALYSHHHDEKLVRMLGRIAEHWPGYLNSDDGESQRQRMWAGVGYVTCMSLFLETVGAACMLGLRVSAGLCV